MFWVFIFFVLFFSKPPFVCKYLDDKLLIFKKLHSRSCFSDKICPCACLRTHRLTVNLVSSQTVTPCRCFWFHGGRCTCVIREQEEVKAGESAALALEEELEISVRSTCQVRCLHMLLEQWCGQPCVVGSEGAENCDVCVSMRRPAHAIKLQFSLQAGTSGLNLAILFLDVKTAAHCIHNAYDVFKGCLD